MYLRAWTTLSAPKSLPVSVPPPRMYRAKVTVCNAGPNPAPREPMMPNAVNAIGVIERAMAVYATTSTKIEALARLRSNDGE